MRGDLPKRVYSVQIIFTEKKEIMNMNKTLTLRYALTAFCTAVLTLLIFLMPVQASAAYSAGTTYVVDCCSLVVRTAPNDGVAGYANEGTAFYVSKVSGDWLYADSISGTSGKTISGWVYAPLCAVSGTSSGNYSSSTSGGSVPNYGVSSGTSVVVTAPESVTLRSSASKESDALDWIGNGVKLNVLASSNGFYQVNFAGKTGWISAKYAEPVSGSKPSGKPAKPSAGTSSGTSSGAAQGSGELNFWKSYNYAEAYCYSPNPDYHYYEDGNCMTYISQILVAGGLPTTEEFRDEKHSFVRIVDFIPYMNRTYGIGKINAPSIEDIKAGDCVLTNDGKHIMWVTSVENGNIYACGNTNDRWGYNLSIGAVDAVVKTSKLF